jgi:hypothetical protein
MQSKSAPKKKTSKAAAGAQPVDAAVAPAPKKIGSAKSSQNQSSVLTAANIETPEISAKRSAKTAVSENQAASEPSVAVSSRKGSVSQHEIRKLAYQFWVERGHSHGSHDEDWVRAEETLTASV